MSSSDLKQDFNMEAGLLNTREEERMMSKEALLPQEEQPTRPRTRRASPGRRAAIAFAACCLLGLTLVSVGGTMRLCPGHLHHASGHEVDAVMVEEAVVLPKVPTAAVMNVEAHALASSHIGLAKRQNTSSPGTTESPVDTPSNTPSSAAAPSTVPTSPADTPSSSAAPPPATSSSAPPPDTSKTQPTTSAPPPDNTSKPPSTSEKPPATSSKPVPNTSNTEPAPTTKPVTQTTKAPGTTSKPSSSSPSSGTSIEEEVTSQKTSSRPSSPSSASDSSPVSATSEDQESSTQEAGSTKAPTQSTIFSGTKTTSKPVPKTLTSTLPNGGVTTLTSTSWVAIVPSAQSTSGGKSPDLQNAAPRFSPGTVVSAIAGVFFGAMLLM